MNILHEFNVKLLTRDAIAQTQKLIGKELFDLNEEEQAAENERVRNKSFYRAIISTVCDLPESMAMESPLFDRDNKEERRAAFAAIRHNIGEVIGAKANQPDMPRLSVVKGEDGTQQVAWDGTYYGDDIKA